MKKLKVKKRAVMGIAISMAVLIWLPFTENTQFTLNSSKSTLGLSGTSTMHDWEADVKEMEGTITVDTDKDQITKISKLHIALSVDKIESGKSKMDDNMFEALKGALHPRITYTLDKYTTGSSPLTFTGKLTIAGVTRTIKTKVNYSIYEDQIRLTGSFAVNMSDFDIDPPEFLLGSFKTGDGVTITFDIIFD